MPSRTSFHVVVWSGLLLILAVVFPSRSDECTLEKQTGSRSVKGLQLKVSANGRYFVDQDGKPFFYLGDTCWLLFQRLTHEEVEEYLQDRVAKGFTVIQAYVIRGLGKRHPDGNSSLLGESPFIDRDATRPNEAFFKKQSAYTFGKFLGERYQNNAVIWYPGGDSVPGKDDAGWVAMAKGLRDG